VPRRQWDIRDVRQPYTSVWTRWRALGEVFVSRLQRLLCLLGIHRYSKPTPDGGMRCHCRRIRYQLR